MSRSSVLTVTFNGLSNTLDQRRIPQGGIWEGLNATTESGVVQGGPRYGDVSARTGAHSGDVGRGFFYAEYGGVSEYLAVLKPNGSSACQLYSINPSSMVWSAVTRSSPPSGDDPSAIPDIDIHFAQFEDKVFALQVSTGTLYVRTIGGGTTDAERWRKFAPEFVRGASLGVATERPSYPAITPAVTDTLSTIIFNHDGPDTYANPLAGGDIRFGTGFTRNGTNNIFHGAIVVTLASAIDLTGVDFVSMRLQKDPDTGDPFFLYPTCSAIFSADIAGTVNASWYASQPTVTEGQVQITDEGSYWQFVFDLRLVPAAQAANIRRVGFRIIGLRTGAPFMARINTIRSGGRALRDVSESAQSYSIEYAYAYFNPTTGAFSNAVKGQIPASSSKGDRASTTGGRLGIWSRITPVVDAALNAQGFTEIRIFRRRLGSSTGSTGRDQGSSLVAVPDPGSTTGADWRWISFGTTIANTGTPQFIDRIRESDLVLQPLQDALNFSDSLALTVQAQALGVWKQHLVLGLDRRLYLSFPGKPFMFLPPPEELVGLPDIPEEQLGRTLFMSDGQTEPVVGLVGQDALYAFGSRGAYAMIGDYANLATPTRRLPGENGSTSRRGQAPWSGGALLAAPDGLWFLRATRALASGLDDATIVQELTIDVRRAWRRLYGTNAAGLVVVAHNDEVWVFNQGRYMRLTKPSVDGNRFWEEGTFPSVVAASSVQGVGLRIMLANGTVARVGQDAAGNVYVTDDGATINWSVTSGRIITGRRKVSGILLSCKGTPTIEITSFDGARGPDVFTAVAENNAGTLIDVSVLPGFEHVVKVSGQSGRDEIYQVSLVVEPETPGYGN